MSIRNALPEICELGIRIDTSVDDDGEINCVAEFRLYKGDIPLGDEECEITISKATISIDLEGLEPTPGTRYGEPRKNNSVQISEYTQQKRTRESNYRVGAETKLSPIAATAALSAGVTMSGSSQNESRIEAAEVTEHLRVRALPSLKWEVSEPKGGPLDGTYLVNDTLLGTSKIEGANRASLTVRVAVKQRYLSIRPIIQDGISLGFFNRLSLNQSRLLNIFIAKSLSSALYCNKKYKGEIILSEQSCELEDEE